MESTQCQEPRSPESRGGGKGCWSNYSQAALQQEKAQ